MLNYKFHPNATYLIAVSYGADSMALLDMLQKEGVKPVVLCVNYNISPYAETDCSNLRAYCLKQELDFEFFDCAALPPEQQFKEGEDFVTWARRIRYDFFSKVYRERQADALFVPHQMDDVIETYLLEKQGKVRPGKYGLSKIADVGGMIVVRPLLEWTHHDLVSYDKEHRVPYSEQSEQFEEEHIRSALRKNVISKMNEVEREQILDEIRAKKDDEIRLTDALTKRIKEGEELEIRALIALPRDEFASVLAAFCANSPEPVSLKPQDIDDIRKFMLSRKSSDAYRLTGSTYLIKEYDVVFLGKQFDVVPYTYVLEAPGVLRTDHFDLDFTGGAEDRGIREEDYPLTIRTALPSDVYVTHGYLQNVLRSYSLWKMPTKLRYLWPIFVNKDGRIVYVPRYAMNFQEYHTSVLKLHLPDEI